MPGTRSDARYRCELTDARHAELLERLCTVKGLVVLSGYPSALYERLLPGWQRIEHPARAAGSARLRTEVLWLSPRAAEALK